MQQDLNNEKSAAVAAVKSFMTSLSHKQPPFPEARQIVLSDSFCVLSHPDELWVNTIEKTMTRVEGKVGKLLESGAKDFEEAFFEPGPDVWLYDNLAAVWAGYRVIVDSNEVSRGINAVSLMNTAEGWQIVGIADTQFQRNSVLPPVSSDLLPDVMKPIEVFFAHLKNREWDSMLSMLFPGSGITNSRQNRPIQRTWPELIEYLKGVVEGVPADIVVEEKIYDVELRTCGDLAIVWTPFTVTYNDVPASKGVNIFTLLKRDEGWVITGCQDTSRPVK